MLTERAKIKRLTMKKEKKKYLAARAAQVETKNRLLAKASSRPQCYADVQISHLDWLYWLVSPLPF